MADGPQFRESAINDTPETGHQNVPCKAFVINQFRDLIIGVYIHCS